MAERRHPTMLAVSTDPLNSRHSIFKHHVDLLPLVTTRPHTFTLIPITVSTLPEQADHEPDSLTPTLPIGWWTWEAWTRSRDRIFLRTVVSSVRYGISLSNLSVKVRFDVGAEEQLPFPQTSALHPKHIGYRYKKSVLWPIKYAAKMRFRPGLHPDPLGSSRRFPDPIVLCEGDIRLQTTPHSPFLRSPLDASLWGGIAPPQYFLPEPRLYRTSDNEENIILRTRLYHYHHRHHRHHHR